MKKNHILLIHRGIRIQFFFAFRNLDLTHQLEKEKAIFISKIEAGVMTKTTSKAFCIENKSNMPILFSVSQKLLVIPSSSAFIERFFSISGKVNDKPSGNMSDATLIIRSFFKANIKLLKEIFHHDIYTVYYTVYTVYKFIFILTPNPTPIPNFFRV